MATKYVSDPVKKIAGAVGVIGAALIGFLALQTDEYNVLYILNEGGKVSLTLGQAIRAEVDLEKPFSDIELGISEPAASAVRFTVRTIPVPEAVANSVNANCQCYKVDDLDIPTELIPY